MQSLKLGVGIAERAPTATILLLVLCLGSACAKPGVVDSGDNVVATPAEQQARAALLRDWRLPESAGDQFVMREQVTDRLDQTRVTFDQVRSGYVIFGQEIHVQLDRDGHLIAVSGDRAALSDRDWDAPRLTSPDAAAAAFGERDALHALGEAPVLYITDDGPRLVYAFERIDGLRRTFLMLSADDGRLIDELEGTYSGTLGR